MSVRYSIERGLAVVTMDDGKANAMNAQLLGELDAAFARAEAEGVAVVLTGRTGFFSGGLDLKSLPKLGPQELVPVLQLFARVMLRVFRFPGPVVAASTGHAIAGGAVLLLAADERLGASGAFKIGLNESQLGLRLPSFVVEMARASLAPRALFRAAVAGELFDPASAAALGLYDAVHAPEAILESAIARAEVLGAIPREAYSATKLLVRPALEPLAGDELLAFERFMQTMR
ncbi:MAG: crotonase/enoyl-CoA hydratase family protein [Deltaproteobacteria bacterium]|nr:crotonase/enoyl-CoA hydratase family protein [Deltaproteobacteria bacterium]